MLNLFPNLYHCQSPARREFRSSSEIMLYRLIWAHLVQRWMHFYQLFRCLILILANVRLSRVNRPLCQASLLILSCRWEQILVRVRLCYVFRQIRWRA